MDLQVLELSSRKGSNRRKTEQFWSLLNFSFIELFFLANGGGADGDQTLDPRAGQSEGAILLNIRTWLSLWPL